MCIIIFDQINNIVIVIVIILCSILELDNNHRTRTILCRSSKSNENLSNCDLFK